MNRGTVGYWNFRTVDLNTHYRLPGFDFTLLKSKRSLNSASSSTFSCLAGADGLRDRFWVWSSKLGYEVLDPDWPSSWEPPPTEEASCSSSNCSLGLSFMELGSSNTGGPMKSCGGSEVLEEEEGVGFEDREEPVMNGPLGSEDPSYL